MKHSFALYFAVLLAGGLSSLAEAAAPQGRPNVLFIAVDDLNCRIHCYGDPLVKTPNLDRLARNGVRFERAYCQFPLCNPSRISLLLGRYPTSTETIDFAEPALLEPDWVTLPEHFRRNGYQVELFGKIFHFPEPKPWSGGREAVLRQQRRHRGMLADLTRWEGYRSLSPPPPDWVRVVIPYSNTFGPVPNAAERDAEANARDYAWTRNVKTANQAVAQLERYAASGRPFFLGVGFYKPHAPLVCPQRFFDLYARAKMPLPVDFAPTPTAGPAVPMYALRDNLDLFYQEHVTEARGRAAIAAYYACVSYTDEKLGQVLDALDRLHLRDNTVIVLWGDHGWHLGEKGMWAKGTLFDVAAHAPLLIVDPRRTTAGQACPRTVEFIDIYPTLVELCGLSMPPGLEGRSLVPLFDQPTAPWQHPAFTLVAREEWLARSVRTERWCYTEWDYGRRGRELYDLQTDPAEMHNLIQDKKAHAAVIAELHKQLQESPVNKSVKLGPLVPSDEPGG